MPYKCWIAGILLKNVSEAVDAVLRRYRRFLLKSTTVVDSNATVSLANLLGKPSPKDKKRHRNEAKRQARYDRAQRLHNEGLDASAISQMLGISVRLTKKLLAAPSCPLRRRPPVKNSILEPFLAELTLRFEAGCHNSMQLWHELAQLGFLGSYATVHKVICRLQQGLPAQRRSSSALIPQKQRYTVRQAKRLFTAQLDSLPIEDMTALAGILEQADLAHLYRLAQNFSAILRLRLVDQLDLWLAAAKVSRFPAFRRLSASLQREYTALKAAVLLPWSSGQVEGQVQRLKLIKREMYGRANFDLLKQRVLLQR